MQFKIVFLSYQLDFGTELRNRSWASLVDILDIVHRHHLAVELHKLHREHVFAVEARVARWHMDSRKLVDFYKLVEGCCKVKGLQSSSFQDQLSYQLDTHSKHSLRRL